MLDFQWPLDSAGTAAVFSAIATFLAAYATLRGPRSAAILAEEMRKTSEIANERRRMKLFVLTTLMQERAAYYSMDAVKAFNLIDVVFNENRTVRDAWADFHSAMDSSKKVPDHAQQEKFRTLLSLMAENIGLADALRSDDLNRVYYPNALAEEEHVRSLQTKANLNRLLETTSPAANTSPTVQNNLSPEFPPAPTI
jgi:hypothetical protein